MVMDSKFQCTIAGRDLAADGRVVNVTLLFGEDFSGIAREVLYEDGDGGDNQDIDGVLLVNGIVIILDDGELTADGASFIWRGVAEDLSPNVAKAFAESLEIGASVEATVVDFSASYPEDGCESCECGGCVTDQDDTALRMKLDVSQPIPVINVQAESLPEGPRAYYIDVGKSTPADAIRFLQFAQKALKRPEGDAVDDIFVAVRDGQRGVEIEDGNDVLERLADLEHQQFIAWTTYFLANLTPENIERWTRQCATPYADLTEKEKASDREWARKALQAIMSPQPNKA